jgi:hypothetical protein
VLVLPSSARREPKGLLNKRCSCVERVRDDYKVIDSSRHSFVVRPNVEVTGATREGSQAVRPMMELGGRTAWLACRGASG